MQINMIKIPLQSDYNSLKQFFRQNKRFQKLFVTKNDLNNFL